MHTYIHAHARARAHTHTHMETISKSDYLDIYTYIHIYACTRIQLLQKALPGGLRGRGEEPEDTPRAMGRGGVGVAPSAPSVQVEKQKFEQGADAGVQKSPDIAAVQARMLERERERERMWREREQNQIERDKNQRDREQRQRTREERKEVPQYLKSL